MATNRPEYRDPKRPRAVKVYTIAQESRYLIVENVPALGLVDNLLKLCSSFGPVSSHRLLDDHASATNYCDVVWIQFATTAAARIAKRTLDDKPFFSNLLRVSYAPEYETVDDLRGKLQERRFSVTQRQQQQQHLVQLHPRSVGGYNGGDHVYPRHWQRFNSASSEEESGLNAC
ncbi:hypothetical protein K492DRAFT_187995 [Lichtheimia hyalospora FSU 10163]|nr:hypothetical protein K492DRAFT_187995 [Lichtheimia hyalospora FSU 10163]